MKHQILSTRPVVSDRGPDPLALQKRISTKMESNGACKVFIKREKVQYVWTVTQEDSGGERVTESHPRGSLNYFNGIFLPVFIWPIILICLVHSPYLVYLRLLPHMHTHVSQNGSYQKGIWVENPLTKLCYGLQGSFFVYVWPGRSVGLENRPSFFRQLPCYSCLGVSVHREWIYNCFTLGGPICLLPL